MKYHWSSCQRCGDPSVGLLGRFFDWLCGLHTHKCPGACEYYASDNHMGPCDGRVRVRHAMTAYHFEGKRNSLDDPNRDFVACEAHWQDYHQHWSDMWAEYYNSRL